MDFIFGATLLIIFLAGYWSLVVFPRQREFKKQISYVRSLQIGDEVITFGGIIGTVTALDDEYGIARLQIAEGVEVRLIAAAVRQRYDAEEIARNLHMAQRRTDRPEISTE